MVSRRIHGEGSIFQRASDGRWVGVVDLGHVLVDGKHKRIRRTVTAPTKRQLMPKFQKLQSEIRRGVLPTNATVAQWMDHWLDTIAAERNAPSTMRTYRGYVENWIKPHLGHLRLDRLHQDHIRALYIVMREQGKSDNTRHHVHSILRRSLTVAEQDQRIVYNPAARVDPPPLGKKTHGKLTLEESLTVLQMLPGRRDAARWLVALFAGLRQGEALGLRWEDIDFDKRLIHVERAAQRIKGQGMQVVPVKSATSNRYVPMIQIVADALWDMPAREGFVFGFPDHPKDASSDWEAWRRLLRDAGVEPKPLHAARATTASLLHEAKVPPKTISEIMGHAQVDVSFRHYISGDSRQHLDGMNAMDDLLKRGLPEPG